MTECTKSRRILCGVVIGICGILTLIAFGILSRWSLMLNKCTLSKNMALQMSGFNSKLLYIESSTFNFSVSCPVYVKQPIMSLKYAYIIPITTYTRYTSLDQNIVYYKYYNMKNGSYSLYAPDIDASCSIDGIKLVQIPTPYVSTDIYPITNMTYRDRHVNSVLTTTGFNYVLVASRHPFTVMIDIPSYNMTYSKTSYINPKSLPIYYILDLIYNSSIPVIVKRSDGESMTFWINNDGLFYKDSNHYVRRCGMDFIVWWLLMIFSLIGYLSLIVFIVSRKDSKPLTGCTEIPLL